MPKHKHSWVLTEDGYTRTWYTEIDKATGTVTAWYGDSSDFSEEGSGEYLQCATCGKCKPVPDGYKVDWR